MNKEHSIDYGDISIHDIPSASQAVSCSKPMKNPTTVQENKELVINQNENSIGTLSETSRKTYIYLIYSNFAHLIYWTIGLFHEKGRCCTCHIADVILVSYLFVLNLSITLHFPTILEKIFLLRTIPACDSFFCKALITLAYFLLLSLLGSFLMLISRIFCIY